MVATDEASLSRAMGAFEAAGVSPAETHLIGDIGIDQLAGHAVWLEVGEDQGDRLDRWLMAFSAFADQSNLPARVSVVSPLLDIVAAQIDSDVEIIVAPGPVERAAAVATLQAEAALRSLGYETRGVEDQARLRHLSEEVSRIAAALSHLTAQENGAGGFGDQRPRPAVSRSDAAPPSVSVERVRETIRARRLRERFFDADYFADPAWDMLLDLFAAQLTNQRVPVSALCLAAAVPATTALRWMKTLTDAGLFIRRADPRDGRRVFIELSDSAGEGMHRYFAELDGISAA
nr:winged helix DNA-binding protein [Sphingomicrobium sp. B8]